MRDAVPPTRSGTGFQPVNHGQDAHATSIAIHHGAYLPHWTTQQAIYSVTFRLADSLPKSVVMAWLAERENIVRTATELNRPLTMVEHEQLQYLFSDKVDRYLDAGHGACWMRQDAIAQIVSNALRHFDEHRYRLRVWCVMPNHVHAVVQPCPGHGLPSILHSWKSFIANQANKALGRAGDFWQPEYYDHLIRDEGDLLHSIEYVLHNPERARLKHWQWLGGGTGFQPVDRGGTGFQPVIHPDHGQDAHATSDHGLEGHATSNQEDAT